MSGRNTRDVPGRLTRRQFLKSSALAAAGTLGARPLFRSGSAAWGYPANDKLSIAVVGTANQAGWNINQIQSQNIVGLCDVDRNYLKAAAARFPQAKTFRDVRNMLSEMHESIDAVLVATPDHIHAPASMMAMRMGKHVYCEKPLAHSVFEARAMAQLAAEKQLATQMGTQIHAGSNYRRVVELIRAGAIGTVQRVHVWCGKSWSGGRYQFGHEVPENLDWDLWLGPSEQRPFCANVHPGQWRRYWQWGTGTLGDMACHYVDLVHWALDLMYPTAVWVEGPEVHPEGTPEWLIVNYQHPARGTNQPPVQVTWYDGGKRPDILKNLKNKNGEPIQWGDGQLFVGSEGSILSNYGSHLLLPEDKFADYKRPEPSIPDSIGHHNEWFEACRNGTPTTCNFTYSGALSEAVLLGNVAFRLGQRIEWDAKALAVRNLAEAAKYIKPDFRAGWTR
ncbi:MAG: gfo/Idh/MocA family oxidoreductase [Planctomycetes bacterium]|nr:gfo/Idh/MocA family oxidoreductase [Planctomycetota bacterium]NOG54480.1 Gfo/Idh/MocA family oxidoreductase [Planctomycetota bacterium]